MSKSWKMLFILSLTLILGVALAQFAGAEKTTDTEPYREKLKALFSTNTISYNYLAKYDLEDTFGLQSSGKIIKSGKEFIDSNGLYYKILSGNTFLNIDFEMKSVFVVDIKKMEQTMGFIRDDLNNSILDITDSSFTTLGKWKIQEQASEGSVMLEFKVNDTANQQVSKVNFVFKGSSLYKMDVYFTNNGEVGSAAQNMFVSMSNFSSENIDLNQTIAEIVRLDQQSKPVLLNKFRDYQLRQL